VPEGKKDLAAGCKLLCENGKEQWGEWGIKTIGVKGKIDEGGQSIIAQAGSNGEKMVGEK